MKKYYVIAEFENDYLSTTINAEDENDIINWYSNYKIEYWDGSLSEEVKRLKIKDLETGKITSYNYSEREVC